jgi:hypothetical protein
VWLPLLLLPLLLLRHRWLLLETQYGRPWVSQQC